MTEIVTPISTLPSQVPWYVYALLGLIDVEANYLVVRAYQYTSITSVMLLDCFTIPCVLLLTRLILKTRYQARHFFGVTLCLSGLVLLVLSDVHSADRGGECSVSLFVPDPLQNVAGSIRRQSKVLVPRAVSRLSWLPLTAPWFSIRLIPKARHFWWF
jgi:drug/metabolite transporter (DMT)-like permease